jgi:DNA-binding transcriptional MocR family regulator
MQRVLNDLLEGPTDELLNYRRDRGDPRLRSLIAKRAVHLGADADEQEVVITGASSGAISQLAYALVDPGDKVIVEELSYPGAVATLRQAGADVVSVQMDADGLDVVRLEAALVELDRQGTPPKALYTIANNHSPTTTNLAADRRRTLADLADRFQFIIIQDDTYGEFWYDGEPLGSLRRFDTERTVHIGSFSKTLAPALRLGWLVAPASLTDVIQRSRTDLGTSGLLQAVVASLMADGSFDSHLEQIIAFYKEKRDLVLSTLDEHCSEFARWETPPGGFFVWVVMDGVDLTDFERYAADEGVCVLLGSHFDVRGGSIPAFRLGFTELSEEHLVESAIRLGRALRRSGRTSP